ACAALETEYGLETAPRRKQPRTVKQSVHTEREHFKTQANQLAERRAQDLADFQRVQRFMHQMNLGHPLSRSKQARSTDTSQQRPVARPYRPHRGADQDRGFER